MKNQQQNKPFRLLLADDDVDDGFFFATALKALPIQTKFAIVQDGNKLISYLSKRIEKLPDVLFLDLNMPRKNGFECLLEIKLDLKLKHIPVIIYSASLYKNVADFLYENGAHYYVCKCSFDELKEVFRHIFKLLQENKFNRPARDSFVRNSRTKHGLLMQRAT